MIGGRLNNRALNSHLTVRKRERRMLRFESPKSVQRFLPIYAAISNTFSIQHNLIFYQKMR